MSIKIDNFVISEQSKTFIVAELSANHNQDRTIALETIKAAKVAGADAVKLQTYTADTLTLDCSQKDFLLNHDTLWDGETLYSLYQKAHTPWEWHAELMTYARSLDLVCFSSPFDISAVDFLEELSVPAYKIASAEITDLALIDYVARKRKPIILSTGMATLGDIELAVNVCRSAGNNDIMLLKCTSAYPTPLADVNLRTIPTLRATFGCEVGLSDHTKGDVAAGVAVALGARLVEKHLILDRALGGPDAEFSLDVDEFAQLVQTIRDTEKVLGRAEYVVTESMQRGRHFSRSLYISQDVKDGELITQHNVKSIRPGHGLHPKFLPRILGKKFRGSYAKGTPVSLAKVAGLDSDPSSIGADW